MFRAPRPASLPGFCQVMADLPATHRQIARHLDVHERTLQRYVAADSAPRAVLLALFWESSWGRMTADAEAAEFGRVHYAFAKSLERRLELQQRQMQSLEEELSRPSPLRAANAPTWRQA